MALGHYSGRFAPSPSGPLHEGSLVAAMASYLDARAHRGRWLLRIEDIDTPRVVKGADTVIMNQLEALSMHWDGTVMRQSQRTRAYQAAFKFLADQGLIYGCACTRGEIRRARQAQPHNAKSSHDIGSAIILGTQIDRIKPDDEQPYPGTCRYGILTGRTARAWRFRTPGGTERFVDRWRGPQRQDVAREAGDFILKRADGLWAYQLAVVVDDGEQGITDIVRGADLLGSTARQRILASRLNIKYPRVMHVPLVCDNTGRKLSKQNQAPALNLRDTVQTLNLAWQRLGFTPIPAAAAETFWRTAIPRWAERFPI